MNKTITKIMIAIVAVTGFGVAGAESASAYSTYDTNQAVSSARYFASTHHFTMAPLTDAGIAGDANYFCTNYYNNLRAGYASVEALSRATSTLTRNRTGDSNKSSAIRYGATQWMCRA